MSESEEPGADPGDVAESAGAGAPFEPLGARIELQLLQISRATGNLTRDEHAVLYGALYAADASRTLDSEPEADVEPLAQVIRSFREHPCRWCGEGLADHGIEPGLGGMEIQCERDGVVRPIEQWLAGPVRLSWWQWLLASIAWIGIPLASLGLASWFMPAIAAWLNHSRRWMIPAAVWVAILALTVVLALNAPDSWVTGFVIFGQWAGGALYGAFQVKPWLKDLHRRRTWRRSNP